MVPDELRGRVMATYSMMFMGMATFGSLLAGLLAGRLGAPAAVTAGGVACIAGAVVFGSRLPALRIAGRELLISQEMAAGEPLGGPPRSAAAPPSDHRLHNWAMGESREN
jgi:MFS family permease